MAFLKMEFHHIVIHEISVADIEVLFIDNLKTEFTVKRNSRIRPVHLQFKQTSLPFPSKFDSEQD